MSLFKMKRGQESKVSSLAKEDGSLIFSLNGANDSTLRLDQSVNGTVQRLGIAVDKAKSADSASTASTANVAKLISPFENATANASRNVWFSDSATRNKPVYNDNFKYNPVSQELTAIATTSKYTKGGESESNYQLNSDQLHATIDLSSSSYNINTWYPIVGSGIPSRGYTRIICYVQLNSGTKPSWSSHSNGGFTCNLDILVKASGWGTTGAESIILDNSYSWCKSGEPNPLGYQQIIQSSMPVIWMRGGGKYFIRQSENLAWSIKTAAYTTNGVTVQPTTTYPGVSISKATIYANLNGTASNSDALGGSSLSQVLASAGGGNAFTGLDTTTNNKIKLTRANGGTVEKTINNVSNASTASFASVSACPQGFASKTSSATWGNTTGTFLTGWHTSSGGDIAFMNDNPASGQLSVKVDGYFYQREGANRVLDTSDADNYVKKAGDTMTGLLTLKTGNQQGIKLGSAWMTSASNTNGEFVLQGGHLRFGGSAWDYNKWAGLKYDPDKNYVYLGIADGTIFTANSAQSGGLLFTPGISGIYIGGTTTTRVATSSDLSSYLAKSGGTMTGALNFANNTWNTVGDDVKIGDHNIAGGLGVIGANGNTRIDWCKYGDASKYQSIIYDGTKLATAGTFKADYFEGLVANATSAENSSRLGGKPSSDYALKTDLSGDINALSAKRLPSYQSVSVANSFFYRYGTAGNTSDGGAWTGFPSATLYAATSTANGFGNALYQKKVGVLHLASGSSAHDLVFQAGGTNGGIAYVATGRNPAYILDTLNYKDKAYTFNKLTASSTFTATSGVVIDGGSY